MTVAERITKVNRNDQTRNVYLAYTGEDENTNRFVITTAEELEDGQEISRDNPISDLGRITLCQLCYSTLGEFSPSEPSFHDGEYKLLVLEVLDCSEDTALDVLSSHIENNPDYPGSKIVCTPIEIVRGL